MFTAESLINEFGIDGEAAVREGLRRFGYDRGITNRNKHLAVGLKINMKNYFTYTRDLPGDPRFKRDRLTLTPQERISHTLKCPFADLSIKYNLKDIGRIYCEEFHKAGYSAYAYGYTQVNLAKTLTQDGDKYCSFSVILRPENLPDELKPVCFEEYDPEYVPPVFQDYRPSAKEGYNSLGIRLFYHILGVSENYLGAKSRTAIVRGLSRLVTETTTMLQHSAKKLEQTLNREFVELNQPFELDTEKEPMWEKYNEYSARELFQAAYCNELCKELSI
ncbi:MAG: L-2-amino-thiazoline-4-carboxylic acid hydrolase [Bacillota bacterium]|nr:L-2-amino-thiazoline-4-carboxylic acid hydrolase [Bacillota bacterium]